MTSMGESYLLDTSVMIPLLLDYGDKLLDVSVRTQLYVTDLGVYEAGNSLWKLALLTRTISVDDSLEALELFLEILRRGYVKVVRFDELDLLKVARLSIWEGITFYDASYIVAAEKARAILVTEDRELREKASRHVKTLIYAQLKQRLQPS